MTDDTELWHPECTCSPDLPDELDPHCPRHGEAAMATWLARWRERATAGPEILG